MKEELINKAYEIAKERYAAVGVDTEKVMETMQNFHLSLHCWQADDVTGFEVQAGSLTGGIQATGNYPGKARNIDELRADILKAASYIPGTHRLNLHEIYGDFQGKVVDRDEVEPEHFKSWIEWGKENNMKLDFNSTSFSHPKSGDLSLSNPDEGIRNFWIEHTKRCRAVAEEMGKAQGDPCIMNLWIHDGSKDITVNRMKYRALSSQYLEHGGLTGTILADKSYTVFLIDNIRDVFEQRSGIKFYLQSFYRYHSVNEFIVQDCKGSDFQRYTISYAHIITSNIQEREHYSRISCGRTIAKRLPLPRVEATSIFP